MRALEDELKVQLLADARPLLANADALRRRVARAARGPGTFTIGFMPGLIVTDAVRAMLGRHPQLTVDVLRTSWDDQTEVIHYGRADVSYVRLPVDQRGLRIQPLLAEPRPSPNGATSPPSYALGTGILAADHPPIARRS